MLLPGSLPAFDSLPAVATGPTLKTLANQWTTTLATAQNVVDPVTGVALAVAVDAGDIVLVTASLIVDAPVGGMKFAFDCPAGSTIEGWIHTSGANLSSSLNERITAINTLTASMLATIRGMADIRVVVHVASAGNIRLQACSTTATQSTIVDAGSTFQGEAGVEDL